MSKSIATQVTELNDRIAKLTERRDALLNKAGAADFNPAEGTVLEFNYGRKEKTILVGVVLGVKRPDEGKPGGTFIVLEVGSGIDKKVLTVPVGDVIRPEQAEDQAAE